MAEPIAISAARFEAYLRRMAALPPPFTTLYVSLAEVLAIIDSANHIALVSMNGQQVPVSYGVAVPQVGSFYPVFQTRSGDRWIKVFGRPAYKRWKYSPAPIEPPTAYPYADENFAPADFMLAVGGIEYADTFLNEALMDGRGEYEQWTLAAPVASLTPPVTNPIIAKLVMADPGGGAPSWLYGVEAADPVAPDTPVGFFELGRVYLTPATTHVKAEKDALMPTDGYILTDTRRDVGGADGEDYFLAKSWNQAGALFTGAMRAPSVADQLELAPETVFGDGRDGVGTAVAATTYNLATQSICGRAGGDCAYSALTAWGTDTLGRFTASPAPAGLVAGDQAMVYVARAKENGDEGIVGYSFIGVVESAGGGAVAFERNNVGRLLFDPGDYHAFIMRVPQYSSVEAQVNSRLWVTPWHDAGPGALAIKTWSWEGAGRIDMTGAGCIGGSTNFDGTADTSYDSVSNRKWEGQGLKDKPAADIGDGVGMFGGGDGAYGENTAIQPEDGSGGAGGGWGAGGWADNTVGEDSAGYGEGGSRAGIGATGDVGERGAFSGVATISIGLRTQIGFLYLGGGGGVGHGADTGAGPPGGCGGGVIVMFAREGSPLMDAGGALRHRSSTAIGSGAAGGGGGCIVCVQDEVSDPRGDSNGSTGGIAWVDAFHTDGEGGNGGRGANFLVRNTRLSGLFSPLETELDLIDFPTLGAWTSEPVDFGRSVSLATLQVAWTLDGTDNLPPRFQVFGANDAQMIEDLAVYPDGDAWYAGNPTYPISSGVELGIRAAAPAARRYWQVYVEMDTGPISPYDTPTVNEIILKAVV